MRLVKRIADWNELRYEQEFDRVLTVKLLIEEIAEFVSATEEVDELDALVDITYVAIGAMWKMGLNVEQIHAAIHAVCDSNDSKDAVKTHASIKANIVKGANFFRPEPRLQEILNERA